ncbi:MAG: SDR family oxidoreductase [Rhodobacter sp.]|nr:SDR family oxidoreductase [Rhodobacter sp.]
MGAHDDTGAIVTGGSQGLGLAICRELIAQGCRRLVFTTRDIRKGDRAATELSESGADVHFLTMDMGDIDMVQAMMYAAETRIGPVNALVNCAANTDRGSILDTTPERWDAIMGPNAKGPFFALQGFANHCLERGHPGSCVNILSIVIYGGLPFLAPYVASKAALGAITKNAAAALAQHRIRVNGINVGWMDTPGENERQKVSHGRKEGWQKAAEANLPFGMLVKPEHVARQTAFLLGPDSGVVTGTLMDFDQHVVGAYPDTNER